MESKPIVLEVHPDYGSLVVGYAAAGQPWYETGSSMGSSGWKANWIYSSVSFGSSDLVLKYTGEWPPSDPNCPSPPTTGDQFKKVSTWTDSGLTKLVLDSSAGLTLFKLYKADSGGNPVGALLGALAVQSNGDLQWWQAATSTPGPLLGKTDSLYLQAQTALNLTCGAGERWYEATDPKQ